VTEDPDNPSYRCELARCFHGLGSLDGTRPRIEDARRNCETGLRIREELVRQYPDNAEYQEGLGRSLSVIAELRLKSKPPDTVGAQEDYERCLAIRQRLVREHPEVPSYQEQLVWALVGQASMYVEIGESQGSSTAFEKARAAYEKAQVVSESLAQLHPRVLAFQEDHARSLYGLGSVYLTRGRAQDSLAAMTKALPIAEQLARDYAGAPPYEQLRAEILGGIGDASSKNGDLSEACRAYQTAWDLWEKIARLNAKSSRYLEQRAKAGLQLSSALYVNGQISDAKSAAERALLYAEELPRGQPLAKHQDQVAALRLTRARSLARLGNFREGIAEAERLVEAAPGNGMRLAGAAQVYSLASDAAQKDQKIGLRERGELGKQYARRATESLRLAAVAGHFQIKANVERLAKEPDLDPLRKEADFLQFLRDFAK
jgi:tetratricopeptide (TPR) repeat protein